MGRGEGWVGIYIYIYMNMLITYIYIYIYIRYKHITISKTNLWAYGAWLLGSSARTKTHIDKYTESCVGALWRPEGIQASEKQYQRICRNQVWFAPPCIWCVAAPLVGPSILIYGLWRMSYELWFLNKDFRILIHDLWCTRVIDVDDRHKRPQSPVAVWPGQPEILYRTFGAKLFVFDYPRF